MADEKVWRRTVRLACVLAIMGATSSFAFSGTKQDDLSFTGPVTGNTVAFHIYTPPGYAGSSDRYPVMYWFHGLCQPSNFFTIPGNLIDKVESSLPPMIIVAVDGDGNSFYADAKSNDARQIATNISLELVPYIDDNYRTLADRGNRVALGFSMGGRGGDDALGEVHRPLQHRGEFRRSHGYLGPVM